MEPETSPPIDPSGSVVRETPLPATPPPVRQQHAVLTWMACAACIVIFLGLFNEPSAESWETLAKYGAYPPDRIRDGAYWALFTSVFVHLQLWHVAFNIYWLYVLGGALEHAIGSLRWLLFFVAAALFSSATEFAFTGSTGIGASGVAYGLFGLMWITRKRFPAFEKILDQRTILLFLLWLVGCLAMTLSSLWAVGNAAHISGLLLGVGVGAAWLNLRWRRRITVGLASLFVLSLVPLFWAPWSSDWTVWRGVRAHVRGEFALAIHWYERSLRLGADPVWCYKNIAFAYLSMPSRLRFEATLETLRKLDPKAAREVESEINRGKP